MEEFIGMVKRDHFDPGSKKLAALMHRLATDPDFPLTDIPDRYRDQGDFVNLDMKPAGVSVVEAPAPLEFVPIPEQKVRKIDPPDVAPDEDDEVTDEEEGLVSGMLLD